MEKQLMNHVLSIFLLWFISKRETHGYDMIKSFKAEDGSTALTASRLYPMLKELSEQGLIAQRREMHGKRAKKVYHVTDAGRSALKEARAFMMKKPLRRRFLKEMIR